MKKEHTYENIIILNSTIETNGRQGGDTGHGGYAMLTFKHEGGCSMQIAIDDGIAEDVEELALIFNGDDEIEAFADALEWAGQQLKVALKQK